MRFPPLVSPLPTLPDGERERAARQLRLPEIGDVGQRRLAAARIAVLGAGGIGAPVLLYLASAGIGTIGIVDDDDVELSNLQRQVLFGVHDTGRPKAEVAAQRIAALSPATRVVQHRVRLTAGNATSLFADYDLVIDGSDTFDTRYAVADACDELGVPLVWGSVLRFDAQVTVFWSRPPAGAAVRLRDVFPTAPAPGTVPSCADAGVLGALCGQVGSLLAAEAVKLVCGIGVPLVGRMLVLDALGASTREVPLAAGSAPPSDPATAASAVEVVSPAELEALRAGARITLLDVRAAGEFAAGSIPGALSVPLAEVTAAPEKIAVRGITVLFCQRGPRARAALRALAAVHPDADLRLLSGGYEEWSRLEAAIERTPGVLA